MVPLLFVVAAFAHHRKTAAVPGVDTSGFAGREQHGDPQFNVKYTKSSGEVPRIAPCGSMIASRFRDAANLRRLSEFLA
jgi:hypothetical protein